MKPTHRLDWVVYANKNATNATQIEKALEELRDEAATDRDPRTRERAQAALTAREHRQTLERIKGICRERSGKNLDAMQKLELESKSESELQSESESELQKLRQIMVDLAAKRSAERDRNLGDLKKAGNWAGVAEVVWVQPAWNQRQKKWQRRMREKGQPIAPQDESHTEHCDPVKQEADEFLEAFGRDVGWSSQDQKAPPAQQQQPGTRKRSYGDDPRVAEELQRKRLKMQQKTGPSRNLSRSGTSQDFSR